MGHESQVSKVAANGRISIPARQRKALGLEHGGMVVLRLEGGELHIRPVRRVLSELQQRVAAQLVAAGVKPEERLADDVIAARRAEAAREIGGAAPVPLKDSDGSDP